jgi:hypothetical protein
MVLKARDRAYIIQDLLKGGGDFTTYYGNLDYRIPAEQPERTPSDLIEFMKGSTIPETAIPKGDYSATEDIIQSLIRERPAFLQQPKPVKSTSKKAIKVKDKVKELSQQDIEDNIQEVIKKPFERKGGEVKHDPLRGFRELKESLKDKPYYHRRRGNEIASLINELDNELLKHPKLKYNKHDIIKILDSKLHGGSTHEDFIQELLNVRGSVKDKFPSVYFCHYSKKDKARRKKD